MKTKLFINRRFRLIDCQLARWEVNLAIFPALAFLQSPAHLVGKLVRLDVILVDSFSMTLGQRPTMDNAAAKSII
jgi:hypothetical protein